MIKFKINRIIALAVLILFGAVSCNQDKFLETTSKSVLTDATMWANEGNADIYLNGCYADLPQRSNQPDNLDNFTDDNDAGFYYTSYNWKKGIVVASGGAGGSVWFGQTGPAQYEGWTPLFNAVRKLNTFMAKIFENKANFSDAWYNKRMDEARFLRAWQYSQQFLLLGGLPIITKPQDRVTMDSTEMLLPRNTFEQTFNFIVSELTTVVTNANLAIKYKLGDADAGRATLGAALATKGYVQLFAASPAYNTAGTPAVPRTADNLQSFADYKLSRWADAAATNLQFMNTYGHLGTSTYKLFSPMYAFWREANEYNSEVVWDRQQVAATMANSFDTYGGPVWIAGVYYTWGNYCPTQEVVNEYEMAATGQIPVDDANGGIVNLASGYDTLNPYVGRDKRFYDFIVYDGEPYKQDWMSAVDTIYTRIDLVHPSKNQIDFGGDDVGNTAYYFKKRLDNKNPRGGNLCGMNHVYYRYAEVLLAYAEAQNEAVGPDASVYAAVNAIRQRPGTDQPPLVAGLTQAQMRTAIKHERRIELVFEQKRLLDLLRWGDAFTKMNTDLTAMKIVNTVPANNSGHWSYRRISLNHPHVFTQKMYFNPIPKDAMDRNRHLIQNFGY